RPRHPTLAVAVEAPGVVIEGPIDLDLTAGDDLGSVALEGGVEIDTGVSVGFALEAQPHVEVAVGLLGGQVAVLTGDPFAVNHAVFNDPFLLADLAPAGQIFAVEHGCPLGSEHTGARTILGEGRGGSQAEQGQENKSPHRPNASRKAGWLATLFVRFELAVR